MLRRLALGMLAGVAGVVLIAPAAGAAPIFSEPAYKQAAGTADEWPELPALWWAGPKVSGVPEAPVADGGLTSSQLNAITSDSCDVVLDGPIVDLVKTADRTQLTATQMRLRVQ